MDPKLCKDCKYISIQGDDFSFAKCTHAKATEIDLVSGYPFYTACSIMRTYPGLCGPQGEFFKEKI